MDFSTIWHPLFLSFKTVGASFVLFIICGIPLAYLLAKEHLPHKWLLDSLVTMPLIFPPIAIGFLLLLLLGRNGWLGVYFDKINIHFIFEFKGLVIAGFIAGLPLMVKPLQAAIELFPKSICEAAYVNGKNRFQTFIWVVLPCIKPTLIAALLVSSARSLGEVGITLMLGGNIVGKTDTMSLAIYNAVFDGDYSLALILCALLIIISIGVFFALHHLTHTKQTL
ncbi:MAG: molybdate ABC transporter permease subunit [Sulfurospirillaceae bacterium]|nr:molybdate ABC transporter permease subunit [Sulfurospirillaceae bacterium]